MQYLDPPGPPFTSGILPGRYTHFLAGTDAIKVALVPLGLRHLVAKDDHGMRDFHPPQHAITALHKDPAASQRFCVWRIDHPPSKSTVSSRSERP
jgi:hypothetical protein